MKDQTFIILVILFIYIASGPRLNLIATYDVNTIVGVILGIGTGGAVSAIRNGRRTPPKE